MNARLKVSKIFLKNYLGTLIYCIRDDMMQESTDICLECALQKRKQERRTYE